MSTRRTVELRTGPALVILGRAPKAVPFLLIAGLLVGGLALRSALGGVLLLVLLAFVGWLTYVSWPVVPRTAQVLRVLVLLLIAAAAMQRF